MDYLDFVVKIVKAGKKLTKDQMWFAYLVFHQTFGEAPIKAADSVLLLDEVKI